MLEILKEYIEGNLIVREYTKDGITTSHIIKSPVNQNIEQEIVIPPSPIEVLKRENEILGQLVSQGELERLEMAQTMSNMELEILSLKGGVVNA